MVAGEKRKSNTAERKITTQYRYAHRTGTRTSSGENRERPNFSIHWARASGELLSLLEVIGAFLM
jgi:hypothetical protein